MNSSSNKHTDKTFYNSKFNNDINNNISINLQKKFRDNKNTILMKKDNRMNSDGLLMNFFHNKDNYHNKEKFYMYNNYKSQTINVSKGKKTRTLGKLNKRNFTFNHSLTPNKNIDEKYKKRFSQLLLILLEKYYKTYLLKFKYLFINNLKNYVAQKIKIRKRNKKTKNIFKSQPKMESKKESYNNNYQEDKDNNIYSTHYNSRRDNLLMYRIKDRNISSSQDSLNKSELCRNKSELIKMKEIIKRRKETQSRSKSERKKEKEKEKGSESLNKIREKKDYIKVKKIIHRNKS
jgi:hypothetical protein